MKVSADYRMLALDALRGKWKTAALTGIAASALGATIAVSYTHLDVYKRQEHHCGPESLQHPCGLSDPDAGRV